MRLLRVNDLNFGEVPSHGPFPDYAILSHTWIHPSRDEVTYQDIILEESSASKKKSGGSRKKPGWQKIQYTINQARKDNIDYIWIDTCCINKRDPTELTEAINCMYGWYKRSKRCYVYLSDVDFADKDTDELEARLRPSQWFTRGWTLQELIAPREVEFFDQNWVKITTRADSSTVISAITRIDAKLLMLMRRVGLNDLQEYSIAHRMSWAAEPRTTRGEDVAYSLLGLFGVIMPLHYGEHRAFMRLQEEIVKISTDQSLFAWNGKDGKSRPRSVFFTILRLQVWQQECPLLRGVDILPLVTVFDPENNPMDSNDFPRDVLAAKMGAAVVLVLAPSLQ
ncbi:hypothetical protein M409DRAFT_62239 [Zasmidium cellare ATCC 36951]|uniref:Uncharacterized protein n=1 Tax=Zasmidium cellare ATCC 36951 TaxID=1080233 RepID=A0A6A6D7E4_ZASCE|nr:uncharacterized protein M409DRAFT_62239 [Zasmidium cellare ATCC 36951]KAF2174089.1 hypothetical protein M409DRAFT_62239 [Zasmidium cellare ATCC 36951]